MSVSSLAEGLTNWAEQQKGLGVTWHRPSDNYRIRLAADELIYFYEAEHWVFGIFKKLSASEQEHLRKALSDPGSLQETKKYWGCRLHTHGDVAAVVALLERRVSSGSW